jgi:hypothetical protein
MEANVRPPKSKAYLRSWVSISMLISWGLSALSGFILWVAPNGLRSGRMLLLFGLNKSEWGSFHTWLSIAALIITILHLVVDWRGLKGSIKYLIK